MPTAQEGRLAIETGASLNTEPVKLRIAAAA
jgi:hypothetical protein